MTPNVEGTVTSIARVTNRVAMATRMTSEMCCPASEERGSHGRQFQRKTTLWEGKPTDHDPFSPTGEDQRRPTPQRDPRAAPAGGMASRGT